MILTVPLQAGTVLASVRYRWIAAGDIGAELSDGITQPSATWPVFRIDAEPPDDAEELIVYDSTDEPNWNAAGYRIALILEKMQTVAPGDAPVGMVPDAPAETSLCRVYGYFEDLDNTATVGPIEVKFTLTEPGPVKSERLIAGRTITAYIKDGQLTNAAGDPWQDLQRNDELEPDGTKYMVTCPELGLNDFQIGAIAAPEAREIELKTSTMTSGLFNLLDLIS